MTEIKSFNELNEVISKAEKAYLLLYKRGAEKSDCAFENFKKASEYVNNISFCYSDVTRTRDIHPEYRITTAPVMLEFEKTVFKNQIKGCQDAGQYRAIFEEAVYQAEIRKNEKSQKPVTVYSTPTCSWCNTLKAYLKRHRIRFTDVDVSQDPRAADELVKRTGQTGVPQTDIGGEIVVGFNQMRINQLLDIKASNN